MRSSMSHIARRPLFACCAVSFATLFAALAGCQAEKQALRADFADYNAILQQNQSEQMLLNIVRMHYREVPFFMKAGSLTASYETSVSGGVDATLEQGEQSLVGMSGRYAFSSKPTVSYAPVEGKEFVQQLMEEISPDTFAMLLRAGWPVRLLGDLLVERVTLDGGEMLVGRPTSASFAKFREFMLSIEKAEEADGLKVVARKDGGLDLEFDGKSIGIERFQLRSLYSAMFMASKDVETPEVRKSETKPSVGVGETRIRASEKPPVGALVSVEYRGWHYSIAADDIRSKDTLALFMQLSRIQAGPPAAVPTLTIPAR
ncbi:MAG: hypothetical protein ACKO0W_02455 [Planctomycetota bacterium]